jgi:ribosome-associated protein
MDNLEALDTGSDELRINDGLSIPRAELIVRASRAGGPGGQHVNTSSTRVAVTWNVKTSTALSPEQRAAIFSALSTKITEAGTIRVVARDTRSQKQNRMLAEERLAETIRKALVVRRPRKKTRPTRSAVERRLDSKKLQSRKKNDRRERGDE